jgi:hypothetical protein
MVKTHQFALLFVLGLCSTLNSEAKARNQSVFDTTESIQPLVITLPDTLKHKIIATEKSTSLVPAQMPWIIALIIGVLSAGVNIWISALLRKSNERNIGYQLNNSRELFNQELEAKLKAEKRLIWIDKLRHDLSECISYGVSLNILLVAEKLDKEKLNSYLEKFSLSKSMAVLLLDEQIVEQREVILALDNLESSFYNEQKDILNLCCHIM